MLKKTIIYVGGFELPDKNGAAQRVVANGKILRSLGYNVVFLGVDKALSEETDLLATKTEHFGFECWSVPYPKTRRQWLQSLTQSEPVLRLVKGPYRGEVAAVICYNHPAVAQWRIRALCRKHDAKYIADVTEWYGSSGGGLLFGLVKWADTTLRMRLMHRLADALITTSSIITAFYSRKNLPVVELPTLYDVDAMGPAPQEELLPASDAVRFIYAGSPFNVGRLDRKRENIKDRLDAVVVLASRLNAGGISVKLSIFGVTTEDYLKAFPEHLSIIEAMDGQIVFHGNKPHSEVISSLRQSDFSIFFRKSSRVTEAGFPSKLAESISCGTPVITNYLGNLKAYRDKVPGLFLVDFEDMDACVEMTKNVLQASPSERAATRVACRDMRPFDYRNYAAPVRGFLDKAGL